MHGYCLSCLPHCGWGRSPSWPTLLYKAGYCVKCRWQWSCGQRRRSETAWLLGSQFRIPLRAWTFVSYVCCVMYPYRVCVSVCNLETSTRGGLGPIGLWRYRKRDIDLWKINLKIHRRKWTWLFFSVLSRKLCGKTEGKYEKCQVEFL